MSTFDIPVYELVDAVIEDLAYCQVTFLRSQEGNNLQSDQKLYTYKYRRSDYPNLAPGDLVVVTKRAAFEARLIDFIEIPQHPGVAPTIETAAPPVRPAVMPGIATVVVTDVEYEYPQNSDTPIAWIAAVIDTDNVAFLLREERNLHKSLRNGAKQVRRQQMVQALLGNAALKLESPLVGGKTTTTTTTE